ncbi:MAG: Acetyl-CoA carboxylase, biotin carboxylase, partial [Mucilaginibacter sp.]|nr:Acetyl-CoA carboxylase, biotin carboxylase [Mucilaginibacter sp.]
NGILFKTDAQPSTYLRVKRTWKKGDKITVQLPMQTTTELLPDGSNYEAVLHGPIVLAAVIDTSNMDGLLADDSRMGHVAQGRLYPLQQIPMFVNNANNDAALFKPLMGSPLTFTAPNLIYPAKYSSLRLVPFYKIQDARYVIYWQRETKESLSAIQKKMAEEEAIAEQVTAITIDVVNAGEQQPESDHFMESENSNTGVNGNRHWRNARGWFSYNMTDKNHLAGKLRITYFGLEKNRKFSILVNDQPIAQVSLDGSHRESFYTEDYTIPETIVKSPTSSLKVKFIADDNSIAGAIYEVRLLKR